MASYDWIDLTEPPGYERLVELLDSEFAPQTIARLLSAQVTSAAEGVLVEHGYVDKDYRSTYYGFYAKKGRQYRLDCVRLHFFEGVVSYDKQRTDIVCDDGRPEDHYFGYIVLRPTIVATLGRSVLSPNIRVDARGTAIQSVHHVNVLGHRLPIWGFPSMAQHVDIAVCAHVSCWAVLRYYSETFPRHKEFLIHDITQLVAPFDPGGLVPSLGFNVLGAERVFQAAGCYPLLVGRPDTNSGSAFHSQLLAYLESGFPLFVAMNSQKHAVVVVGYSWRTSAVSVTSSSHVWCQVDALLVIDDNTLPYRTVPVDSDTPGAELELYTADSFDAFIVALPDKIYYPADAVDKLSRRIGQWLTSLNGDQERLKLRRYFITTVAELRKHARENRSYLGENLVGLIMRLNATQFVWIVEYSSHEQWENGHVSARAIVDATASPRDPVPMWLLHDQCTALVFDRSSAKGTIATIPLNRGASVPLPRIDLNLRPVAGQPPQKSTNGDAEASGG